MPPHLAGMAGMAGMLPPAFAGMAGMPGMGRMGGMPTNPGSMMASMAGMEGVPGGLFGMPAGYGSANTGANTAAPANPLGVYGASAQVRGGFVLVVRPARSAKGISAKCRPPLRDVP